MHSRNDWLSVLHPQEQTWSGYALSSGLCPQTEVPTKRFREFARNPSFEAGVLSFLLRRTSAYNASGSSCCQRLITPAIVAPRMGASQNNHSCAIYAPPANRAGPVLRAGLTEALVTGIRKR